MRLPTMLAGVGVLALCAGASAGVRVIHLSPDTGLVDVYAESAPGASDLSTVMPALQDVPYLGASGYLPLPTDSYRFRVTPADTPGTVAIDATAPIDGALDYTVAAVGLSGGSPSIQPLVLEDDLTPTAGKARVRFVHASPDVGTVDINLAGTSTELFGDVGRFTSGGYVEVDPGAYDLDVILDATQQVALTVSTGLLKDGFVYTVFATGLAGDQTIGATRYTDVPAPGALGALALGGLAAARRRRR